MRAEEAANIVEHRVAIMNVLIAESQVPLPLPTYVADDTKGKRRKIDNSQNSASSKLHYLIIPGKYDFDNIREAYGRRLQRHEASQAVVQRHAVAAEPIEL